MQTIQLKDASGNTFYFNVTGSGTEQDPYTPTSEITVQNEQVTEANPIHVSDETLWTLRKIAQLLKPLQNVTAGGSNRLNIDVNNITTLPTLSAVTTVSTVSTVNNMASLGGITAFSLLKDTARNAYANSIRTKISF